ncbi:hypothetical protein RHSIM_Rhsim07G0062400 [Rhododendron simsii]|uniref:Dirigent protein n=1 Tax=Rhododendron simsii TaxID=118357 RepID=A0A834GSM9_RHOSS|nr:hypothetical protein RHSIM_Rhsim07G0062400 [Rhododendron simsii]
MASSLNFPLFFTFLLATLLTTSITTNYGTFSDEVSEAITLKRIEITTHLHFYFHDILSGKNPTAVKIAGPLGFVFGSTFVIDDALTEGPKLTSKLVGRAQGMYVFVSREDNPELLMVVTYIFVEGPYNGSSISVLGQNPVLNDVREFPVVGGSGLFRLARGYALAHTIMFDFKTGDATVEYNLLGQKIAFGATAMADDPLTEELEPGSKVVGRAQGMYALASQRDSGLLMVMNFAFLEGGFNGSTLSILGRNRVLDPVREMPIVGGSGLFMFARGYALARTVRYSLKTGDAVVEYNVFVTTSCNAWIESF